MSSPCPFSGINKCLAKDQYFCVVVLVSFCYFFGIILSIYGLQELYKSNTFITRQCRVKSVELKLINLKLYPRWNIMVVLENQTIDDFLIASTGLTSESDAWSKAEEYKINQTYPCYRSGNQTSFIDWSWQWDKPSKFKAYSYLFSGVLLIAIGTVLLILRRRYQAEIRNTRQPQEQPEQLEMSLRTQAQQQTTADSESPPPTYDEAVQRSVRKETRT